MSTKQTILSVVGSMPENISVEAVIERLYLLMKIEKGCQQADAGETLSHVEAMERIEKWLK